MKDKHAWFKEIHIHLIEDNKPSNYLKEIICNKEFYKQYPYNLLKELTNTPQSPKHHPEGSVWNHTLLVVDYAAERKSLSEEPSVFMWAALLHDIGKPSTTSIRKDRVTSYDHDKVGAKLAAKFLQEFNKGEEFINRVSNLVRWHMQALFVVKDLPFAKIEEMLSQVSLEEIGLLTLCDRLGRGEMTEKKVKEEMDSIERFKNKCKDYAHTKNL